MQYIPILTEEAFRIKHFSRFLRNVPQNYDNLVMNINIDTSGKKDKEMWKKSENKKIEKQFIIEKKNIGIA